MRRSSVRLRQAAPALVSVSGCRARSTDLGSPGGQDDPEGGASGRAVDEGDLAAGVACGLAGQPQAKAACLARVSTAHPGVEDLWGELTRDPGSGVRDVDRDP